MRSTVQPSDAMYPVHSAAPEKYSWLPVMKTRASRAVASPSGSTWCARVASEPSTRSPVCASTSTSSAFTWATIRWVHRRGRNGPRWVSVICPMRSPSSPAPSPSIWISRSRTGTGPSARYAPQASNSTVQPSTAAATTRARAGSGNPASARPSRTSSPATDHTNSCQITPSQKSPAATAQRTPRPWPSSSAVGNPTASTTASVPSAAPRPGRPVRLQHQAGPGQGMQQRRDHERHGQQCPAPASAHGRPGRRNVSHGSMMRRPASPAPYRRSSIGCTNGHISPFPRRSGDHRAGPPARGPARGPVAGWSPWPRC